jgi:hypothetical protein
LERGPERGERTGGVFFADFAQMLTDFENFTSKDCPTRMGLAETAWLEMGLKLPLMFLKISRCVSLIF